MKVLISILFFLLANNSFAEDMRYYDVEVIVLENLSETERNSEDWPIQVNLNQPEKTVQLGQPVLSEWLPKDVDLKSSYKVLDSADYKLTSEVEKLAESTTQRVIFHTAWRQPGLDKIQALPIYFKREVPAAPVIENENKSTQNGEDTSSTDKATMPSILEGIFRVTLARFLHFEAELTYRSKMPELSNSENPFEILDDENMRNQLKKQGVFHLKQERRRMRSSELHYLDHPVLGILINITPYEEVVADTSIVK